MQSLKAKKYTIIKRKSFGKHLMEKELTGEIYTEIININEEDESDAKIAKDVISNHINYYNMMLTLLKNKILRLNKKRLNRIIEDAQANISNIESEIVFKETILKKYSFIKKELIKLNNEINDANSVNIDLYNIYKSLDNIIKKQL